MIENNINIAVHYHVILFSWNLWAMVRTLKVFVERKTFLVRLEGEHRGNWCLITEHSRGSVFVLGFEKDAVGWMIEHLTKAIEMKSHLGFNRKFRGKCCVHLMEVGFNNHIRFIRISEFATNRLLFWLFLRARRAEDGRILNAHCLQCWWSTLRMQSKKEGNIEGKDFPTITWVLCIGPSRK